MIPADAHSRISYTKHQMVNAQNVTRVFASLRPRLCERVEKHSNLKRSNANECQCYVASAYVWALQCHHPRPHHSTNVPAQLVWPCIALRCITNPSTIRNRRNHKKDTTYHQPGKTLKTLTARHLPGLTIYPPSTNYLFTSHAAL